MPSENWKPNGAGVREIIENYEHLVDNSNTLESNRTDRNSDKFMAAWHLLYVCMIYQNFYARFDLDTRPAQFLSQCHGTRD